MKFTSLYLAGLVSVLLAAGCRKDEPVPVVTPTFTTATIALVFDPQVNGQPMELHPKYYQNSSGDIFSVTKFNYYISNIKLTRTDGLVYRERESYHLLRHVEGDESFTIRGVPEGEYRKIEFMIGVDSLRNTTGVQSGALDPAYKMFWDWNTGYIFYKLEGSYATNSQPQISDYAIHIGGFKGPDKCLQTCTLTLDKPLMASRSRQSTIRLNVAAEEVFTGPREIGFDYYYSNISERTFREISENYKDMFSVGSVEN